jgi:signal peptidase II
MLMMKRRDWIWFVIAPLSVTWILDRVSKHIAESIQGFEFYGPVGLVLHHNHGAILGLFSNLPPVLRIVSLSTGGAFLIFTFFTVQYLLPIRSRMLRTGMSTLLGGILGNVIDRILYGYVIDFLVLGSPSRFTPFVFNIADALQWVGYLMIVYALIKDSKILWPDINHRKSYWINPRFQLRYCIILVGFGVCFALIAGIYSYTFMKVSIDSLIGERPDVEARFLIPFVLTFIAVSAIFWVLLFIVGLILSHRAAGPVYAFEKFLEDMVEGKTRTLKLRAGDEFPHLEKLARELAEKLNKKNSA